MKLLFLEVRSKTELYLAVARKIKEINPGVEIVWVVQNRSFNVSTTDKTYCLGLPLVTDLKFESFDDIDRKVIDCDRFSLHFDAEPWYYKHYRGELESVFIHERPDFVFGELGNFFTHYACLLAERSGIPFYDVETSRFPNGCIGFFKYDKWSPLKLREVSDNEVEEFLSDFLDKRPVPDYMNHPSLFGEKLVLMKRRIFYRLKVLLGYVHGERFCTQNPIQNALDKHRVTKKLALWDSNAVTLEYVESLSKSGRKILLYPLQMQPEFNLEVWGYPNNKQEDVVLKLSESLPDDWVLILKANPKSYFEMNRFNFGRLARSAKILLLDRSVKMPQVEPLAAIVATVTGTVQIERLLSNRPVLILGETPFAEHSCIKKELVDLTPEDYVSAQDFRLTDVQVRGVARYLLEHSLPGVMGEPVNSLVCMAEANVNKLSLAFLQVIENNRNEL